MVIDRLQQRKSQQSLHWFVAAGVAVDSKRRPGVLDQLRDHGIFIASKAGDGAEFGGVDAAVAGEDGFRDVHVYAPADNHIG